MSTPAVLNREVFRTSRELEYFTPKELQLQTGHGPARWAEVILKELVDNGLDACEGANIPPEIKVEITRDSITVTDNGPGLPPQLIESVLNYNIRASSKDAYISPTRGAQGNALKTVVAIPYVLSGCTSGEVEIQTKGELHNISVAIDRIAQRPSINHTVETSDFVKNGTSIKVFASTNLDELSGRFLQLIDGYSLFNPHATFEAGIGGTEKRFERTLDKCEKWLPNEPTSPHWYSAERLRALIAAYINAESNGAQPRTVREFISEFRGLSATKKQKSILQSAGLSNVYLRDLVKDGDVNRSVVDDLLMLMRGESKAVKPAALGQAGEKHLRTWFAAQGVELRTFKYKRYADTGDNNMPYVVEFAFALRADRGTRRLLTGINWSPTLADPFRSLNRYGIGLDGLLNQFHISPDEPVTFVLHLACPHLNYTDRGKSSLEDL